MEQRPQLVFFHSDRSGPSRRVNGFLAQVLQRRANHAAFRLYRVDVDKHPGTAHRFRITTVPTLLVIDQKRVRTRIEAPRGCREIQNALKEWLR